MNIKAALRYVVLTATLLTLVAAVSARPDKSGLVLQGADAVAVGTGVVLQPKGASGKAIYIIRMSDAPVASYKGGIAGLAATSPSVLGTTGLNMRGQTAVAYQKFLADKQATLLAKMADVLQRSVSPVYQYSVAFNGMAVTLSPAEATAVAKLGGVVSVQRDFRRQIQTDVTPEFLGATGVWDGSNTSDGVGTQAEGVIVGVIDTGIWPEHPSFADDGSFPAPPAGWGGSCSTPEDGTAPYTCNNKLIGAQHFLSGYTGGGAYDGLFLSARDDDGHGSHTASTAAGNENVAVTLLGIDRGTISGIAPRAHVSAYKACGPGGCAGSDLVAAIDTAVADGVHVINYSIGGGSSDPWADGDALAFLAARDAGVFVAASAGNAGPGASTVGSPSEAPWVTSVGASTSNRHFISDITLTGPGTPPTGLYGASVTTGVTDYRLVDAVGIADSQGDASGLCLNPYVAGTFQATDVVLCERGVIARVARGDNVLAGGGGGVILFNPVLQGLATDNFVIPAVHVESDIGQVIKDYIDANPGAEIRVSFTEGTKTFDTDPRVIADMMASFSSRGPALVSNSGVIKPNVTAPGVQILAGASPEHVGEGAQGELFQAIQGTSMSSPHTAGAGALLRALHPDWSASAIESALMMTGNTNHVKEDGVTPADPFDMGGGRIDLHVAGKAGLVLNETAANYTAADPAAGGDPTALNIAGLANANCVQSCSWIRTLESSATVSVTWTASLALPDGMTGTVTPDTFTLGAGGSQAITVAVSPTGLPANQWAFAELQLASSETAVPAAHMPIAVVPNKGSLPGLITIETGRNAGSYLVQDLTAIEITELTTESYGLGQATIETPELAEDSTNGDPYDTLDEVAVYTVDVAAGAARLVAQITASEAPDVDLYVGLDANGDGLPSADEQLGASTSGSFIEYVNLDLPQAGSYWILVQNWAASAAGAVDSSDVAFGVAGADNGNLTVTGPAAVPALQPFDVYVGWDGDMAAGDILYGAFTLGSDPANAGNIGQVNVDIHRIADDVTKTAAGPITALPGDTITYTLTVNPNVLPEDVTYTITDTLPAGVTYVDGSATATAGTVAENAGVITWTGTMPSIVNLAPHYEVTDSNTDPSCDTGFGGYVDLEAFGILANAGVSGDTVAYTAFSSGDPINFYGVDYQGMSFTDDGFALFDFDNNYGGQPWVAQAIPDPEVPNNVIAALWQDLEIFYDQANNHGVSLATAGAPGGVIIVEYDDIQFFGGSADTFDFEVVVWRAVDDSPGAYEVIVAFDNLNGSLAGPLTVGVENTAGNDATALINNGSGDGVLSNGLMVCYDLIAPAVDPVTITYAVTVDAGTLGQDIINTAVSITDNFGSQAEGASATVRVGLRTYMPAVYQK